MSGGTEKPAEYYVREERRKAQRAADRARNAGDGEAGRRLRQTAEYHWRIAALLEAAYGEGQEARG